MTTETTSLETIGHLCQTFQRSYAVIRRALAEIGAEPALTINGVEHYAEADVERLAVALKARREGRR